MTPLFDTCEILHVPRYRTAFLNTTSSYRVKRYVLLTASVPYVHYYSGDVADSSSNSSSSSSSSSSSTSINSSGSGSGDVVL